MKIARYRWTPLTIASSVLAVLAMAFVVGDMLGLTTGWGGGSHETLMRFSMYVIYGGVALMTVRMAGGSFVLAWFFAVALASLDAFNQLLNANPASALHYWLANLIAITVFLAFAFFVEPMILRHMVRRRLRMRRAYI